MIRKLWRLSEGGVNNLGLACTDEGLVLGRTPLVERRAGRFVVRDRKEIERLLKRAFPSEFADRLIPSFAAVATALNANDPCLARIAAVHLRIPDLSSEAARDAVEAEDILVKYGDWNPELHPRTGTGPNPGWFAPTGGSVNETPTRIAENDDRQRGSDAVSGGNSDWVRLPPGNYIDELADFVEWIANAKPEDEQTIRAEIKRYYYDVGDIFGGEALHRALSDILEPGLPQKARQDILNSIARYAAADPAEMGQLRVLLAGGVLSSAAAEEAALLLREEEAAVTGVKAAATADAEVAATELPSQAWKWGWAKRGRYFEEELGRTLHPNFPVIDRFVNGIVTSIKSIDLGAATYQNAARLAYRMNKCIDDVAGFAGAQWGDDEVEFSAIKGRAVSLAVPKGSMTELQRAAIEAARRRGAALGVDLIVTAF